MYELPTTVTVGDNVYNITNKADYRMILDCFSALEDNELDDQSKVICALIIFYEDINSVEDIYQLFGDNLQEAIEKMYLFFSCNQESIGMQVHNKLIDWEMDAQIISAGVNNVAHTEIRALPYLHWWTFLGYFTSIGESLLSTIVNIRDKIVKGKKLEKHEKEFKRDNPEYFNWRKPTRQQLQEDEEVRKLWNSSS